MASYIEIENGVDMDQRLEVMVTHYINPSHFYFKYRSDVMNLRFAQFEMDLDKEIRAAKKLGETAYEPKEGEMVAVKDTRNKHLWVRAIVDHIFHSTVQSSKYALWLLDYGVPFIADADHLRRLPSTSANKSWPHVHRGGLVNLLPGEERLDWISRRANVVLGRHWPENIVSQMNSLFTNAEEVYFESCCKVNDTSFGTLTVTTFQRKTIYVNQLLRALHSVFSCETEEEFIGQLSLTDVLQTPRWKDNANNPAEVMLAPRPQLHASKGHSGVDDVSPEEVAKSNQKVMEWMIKTNEEALPEDDFNDSVSQKNLNPIPEVPQEPVARDYRLFIQSAGTTARNRLQRYHPDSERLKSKEPKPAPKKLPSAPSGSASSVSSSGQPKKKISALDLLRKKVEKFKMKEEEESGPLKRDVFLPGGFDEAAIRKDDKWKAIYKTNGGNVRFSRDRRTKKANLSNTLSSEDALTLGEEPDEVW